MKINPGWINHGTLQQENGRSKFLILIGNVYKLKKTEDNKIFAFKTITIPFTSETLKALKNEDTLALKISHPNVIKYYLLHDGTKYKELPPYIIMEYAPGGTLGKLIKAKKETPEFFTNEELKLYFNQLIDGMEAINEHLIHRDIKPDNILISTDALKITDFGLSKVVGESTRRMEI